MLTYDKETQDNEYVVKMTLHDSFDVLGVK